MASKVPFLLVFFSVQWASDNHTDVFLGGGTLPRDNQGLQNLKKERQLSCDLKTLYLLIDTMYC